MQSLFEWGEEIRNASKAEVIAVDFRDPANVQAALICVEKAYSLGALVPHLIATALNVRRVADIETAVEASGVPCAIVCRKFGNRTDNAVQRRDEREMVAMVVTADSTRFTASSNHEVARTLSRITKRPVIYVDVPENIARQSMRQLGMPASLVEGLLQYA